MGFASHCFPKTAQKLRTYFPFTSQLLPKNFPPASHPECFRERIIFHGISPSALVLFPECFRDTKTCLPAGRPTYRSAGKAPPFASRMLSGLPRGKRSAQRCFAVRFSTSWCCHLSPECFRDCAADGLAILQCVTTRYDLRHGNNLYGNMKAPSGAEQVSLYRALFASRCTDFFVFTWLCRVSIDHQLFMSFSGGISFPKTSHLLPIRFPLLPNCFPSRIFSGQAYFPSLMLSE